jgi:radical SAM protein with 4Fe4S-binding SPASM domain
MRFKKIYLEITTNCNKKCEFCGGTNRKSEFLSTEDFEFRLKQIKDLGERIYLHVAGEPLLHPNFADFLKIAEKNEVSIGIATNGLLLEKQFSALLSPALAELNISLHSAENSEEYENFINLALKLSEKRNDLLINFRMWNQENMTEIGAQKRKITDNIFLHFAAPFSWDKNAEPQKNGFCYGLQSHFGILCDGEVVPCCICKNGEIVLGNINEKSITQILANPRTKAIAGGFSRRILVEGICQKCEFARQKFPQRIIDR